MGSVRPDIALHYAETASRMETSWLPLLLHRRTGGVVGVSGEHSNETARREHPELHEHPARAHCSRSNGVDLGAATTLGLVAG